MPLKRYLVTQTRQVTVHADSPFDAIEHAKANFRGELGTVRAEVTDIQARLVEENK